MAFLDALQCDKVRQAFVSGQSCFVLSSDSQTILWANGAAAYFFGFSGVSDAIGSPTFFDAQTRRQILNTVATGQPMSLQGKVISDNFALSVIDLDDETCAILGQAIGESEYGQDISLVAGLDERFVGAAILNDDGEILDATPNFQEIDAATKILLKTIDDYVPVKTVITHENQQHQIGVIQLSEKPKSFLLISVITNDEKFSEKANAPQVAQLIESRLPLQFIWKMDKDASFCEISVSFSDVVGMHSSDVLGKSFADLAHEWRDKNFQEIDKVIKTAQPWAKRVVLWPMSDDTGKVSIEFSGLPVVDGEHHVQGYRGFGIITEVFAKQLAQNTVPSNLEAEPSNAVPTGLSDIERSAFREIAERLRGELDLPVVSVLPPQTTNTIHQHMTELAKHVEPSKVPEIASVNMQASLIEELDFLNATNSLSSQSGTLLTLLDTATDGIIWLDGQGEIQSISSAASALTGYEIEDLEGTNLRDIFSSDTASLIEHYLNAMQNKGVAQLFNKGETANLLMKDGGTVSVFITLVPLAERSGYAALLRDMSAVQHEIKSTTDTQQTAHLVHEIRTPLNAIIGFAEIMRDGSFGTIENNRYQGYLRDIVSSGKHILSLVNQLLDKAKNAHDVEYGAGHKSISQSAPVTLFDLKSALRGCVSLLENQANNNGIIMRVVLPSYIPAIAINEQKFRQIIWNLLSNAIRFTQSGGQVVINASFDGKCMVKISVSDNGIGMNHEEIVQAMRPYGQVARKDGKTGDNVFTGTGLGLPMTKAMVEENEGTFLLLSKENHGTTVEMTFPIFRGAVSS